MRVEPAQPEPAKKNDAERDKHDQAPKRQMHGVNLGRPRLAVSQLDAIGKNERGARVRFDRSGAP